jgi:hypothetical protein
MVSFPDCIRLRGENSKNGEGRVIVLEGELTALMERRKAARTVKTKTGILLSQFMFHNNGEPIVDFRKAWARACCMAGVGKMVCPCPYRIFCAAHGGCHCPNQTGSSNSWTCSSLVNEIRAGTRVQRSTVRRQISRVRAEATRSALDLGFRRPVVRNGGAVPRPAVAPRPIPFPAAESLVAPASPCPTKDVFSIGDNNRNTN